jgi:hypothetical protein
MQDNQALMITYASGGSTPGIPMLVRRPKSCQKLGACGLVFLWADWNNLGRLENISKQSKIATSHKGLIDLKLEDVQGQSIEEINNGIDPFTEL